MARKTSVRILLARMCGDDVPCVVAAIDEAIWENWDDEDEAAWIKRGQETWGIDYETEFRVVVAEFPERALTEAFATPVIQGEIA